jgi:hypothetical protein
VSFGHALDMATGRYESTEREVDENTMVAERFFYASTHAEKIRIACTRFARREPPGRRWVYHTSDTYVLGRAMAEFWRARHGPGADFFADVIVEGLWRPLQLSPTAAVTRRTADAAAQPFTGWGLTLLRDDFAKLGAFAAIQGGRIDGESRVDPREFAAALQRRKDDPGLPAGSADLRYNNGFWAWDATRAAECARPLWVPFMSGFGGLSVVLMPGVVYYYVSDGYEFRFARAVRAARAIVDPCEPGA